MELIQIKQVNYGISHEVVPDKGDTYINPDHILYAEKRHKKLGKGQETYVYIIGMKGGCDFHVSEESFNRIVGTGRKLLPCPESYAKYERPERPHINPGKPTKTML